MKQAFVGLICIGFIVVMFITAWVNVFRLACRLCNIEKPGMALSTGLVIITFIVSFIAEFVLGAVVRASYKALNLPVWESGVVIFFLGLPLDMVINAGFHSAIMKLPFSKGIEVWFVQRLILLPVFIIVGLLVGATIWFIG